MSDSHGLDLEITRTIFFLSRCYASWFFIVFLLLSITKTIEYRKQLGFCQVVTLQVHSERETVSVLYNKTDTQLKK